MAVETIRMPNHGVELDSVGRHRELEPAVLGSHTLDLPCQLDAAAHLVRVEHIARVDDRDRCHRAIAGADDDGFRQNRYGGRDIDARVQDDAAAGRNAETSGARVHRKTTGATGNERESPIDVVVGHNAGQADAGARCDTVRVRILKHGINVFDLRAGNGRCRAAGNSNGDNEKKKPEHGDVATRSDPTQGSSPARDCEHVSVSPFRLS